MFRTAELGQTVSDKRFKKRARELRTSLLAAQHQLLKVKPFQVIIDVAGVDGAGKGGVVNLMHRWMDTRWLLTRSYSQMSEEEAERPEFWRFWRDLPPRGRIGLFLRGRYSKPLMERVNGTLSEAEYDGKLDRIAAFERGLVDDGALVLKFWMHLGRAQQKQRLHELETDPATHWRVTDQDWRHWEMYEQFEAAAERMILKTHHARAPWIVVESADRNFRNLQFAEALLDAMRRQLEAAGVDFDPDHHQKQVESPEADPLPKRPRRLVTVFSRMDMTPSLDRPEFEQQLHLWQGRHHLLQREARNQGISTIQVYEGPDTAGKGGVIRRVVRSLDARNYQVIQVAAPTEEEAAQHYLWRFWRQVSRAGRLTVFDRSWYGRVLVERVEGFATDEQWRRAYAEINDFEEQLNEHGILLSKFYLHITPEEQMARLTSRLEIPHKRWKLTAEDWRNRARWFDYELAAHEMVERTDTHAAPWTLVPANDKRYARIRVLQTLCVRLAARLDLPPDEFPEPSARNSQ